MLQGIEEGCYKLGCGAEGLLKVEKGIGYGCGRHSVGL